MGIIWKIIRNAKFQTPLQIYWIRICWVVFLVFFFFWLCWVLTAVQVFSSCSEGRLLFGAVHRILTVAASFAVEPRLQTHSSTWAQYLWLPGSTARASVIVVLGLGCSTTCGIFPGQGSNLCPLHQQAHSYPLYHWGSPRTCILNKMPRWFIHNWKFWETWL